MVGRWSADHFFMVQLVHDYRESHHQERRTAVTFIYLCITPVFWLFCLTGTFSKTKPLKDVNRINSSKKLGEFSPDCIITHVGLPQNTQVCLVKTITITTTTKDNLCSLAMGKKKRSHQEGAVQVVGIMQVSAVLLMGTGRLLSVLQGVSHSM